MTLTVPILFASRRSNNAFSTTHSSGLGDMAVVAQGWLWNPRHAKRGNISIGLGVQAPTGKDNVQNNLLTSATATTPTLTTVDYSIQPGSGGWGMIFQWQAFRCWAAAPRFTPTAATCHAGRHQQRAAQRQRAQPAADRVQRNSGPVPAAGGSVPSDSGDQRLALKFGPRMEGVPAANLIGNDLGFRRPGFAISAGARFIYARGNNMVEASIGRRYTAIARGAFRIRSSVRMATPHSPITSGC